MSSRPDRRRPAWMSRPSSVVSSNEDIELMSRPVAWLRFDLHLERRIDAHASSRFRPHGLVVGRHRLGTPPPHISQR
jgi:hypothetical protein